MSTYPKTVKYFHTSVLSMISASSISIVRSTHPFSAASASRTCTIAISALLLIYTRLKKCVNCSNRTMSSTRDRYWLGAAQTKLMFSIHSLPTLKTLSVTKKRRNSKHVENRWIRLRLVAELKITQTKGRINSITTTNVKGAELTLSLIQMKSSDLKKSC